MSGCKTGGARLAFCYVLIFVLSLAGFAQDATSAQKLYGTWYTEGTSSTAVRHEFRHNAATGHDEMVVTRSCAGDRKPVIARAVSTVEVFEDTIRVLNSSSDVETAPDKSLCEARIEAGSLSYTLSDDGNSVTLTNPGGNPDLLELARADAASVETLPQGLYGSWMLPPADSKEMRVQLRWVFYSTAEHRAKVRQIAVCTKGSDSLVSHADSEITVAKDQITVLESASHERHDGAFTCKASIAAGSWRYAVAPNGVTLTLSIEGSKPMTLTREAKLGLE